VNLIEREVRLPDWLERLVARFDRRERPAWDLTDLTTWHAEHRRADSGVWAIRPPCGWGNWTLYRPGSQPDENGFSRAIDVAGLHPATDEYGGDNDRTVLADVRWWMEVWVAQHAGAPVIEMVEGWSEPYGSEGQYCEYTIYARTERRPS
jgi:hypothetical protein